jgi:pimeloyl-ACP methyl ester carboxylesterase
MDHRDIGDSDPFTTPYRTADQADDAAAVLKALGVQSAAIVGISMGGYIALELALRHPELVHRLVLTSTSAGGASHVPPGPQMIALLTTPPEPGGDPGIRAHHAYTLLMASGFAETHPEAMEHIAAVARYRPQSGESYLRQLQACWGHDVAGRLGEIQIPTLVVHGESDPLIPVGNGHFLAQHIPHARLILYPNTGHIPIIERAEDYNRDVLTFLSEDITLP